MFLTNIGIGQIISNSILSIIIQALMGGIIYFLVLAIRKDTIFLEGIQMIKKKLGK